MDLVRELDDAVAGVDGAGFRVTPLVRAPAIARAAGLGTRGTVWVKDETGNVAGSHKARHLFGILLELRVAEALGDGDPASPLAIASCGNAALAAAVVARAAARELRVFVPDERRRRRRRPPARRWARVVVTCPRRPGEAGDPSYLRLQEALAEGAVPFTCQGPDNGLAIEGGATLAWEIADELRAAGASLDRIVVQVGGGALASGIALGFDDAAAIGAIETVPTLDTVQARGGAPLARAYERVLADLGLVAGTPADPDAVHDGLPPRGGPPVALHVAVGDGARQRRPRDPRRRDLRLARGRAGDARHRRPRGRRRRARPARGQRARLRRHRHRRRRDGHRRRGRPARARRGRAS